MAQIIEPVAGDPSTEPVATAQQSHVDGRVGPPTIAQDAAADAFVPADVEQVEPGTVLPADYPFAGGVVETGDYAGPQVPPKSQAQIDAGSTVKTGDEVDVKPAARPAAPKSKG